MKFRHLFFLLSVAICTASAQLPEYSVTIYDSSTTSGYYFLTDGTHLLILDRFGEIIYVKPIETGYNFTLQKNRIMTFMNGQNTFTMDSTFAVTDFIHSQNGYRNDTRDVQFLPNGNALVLGEEWTKLSIKGISVLEKRIRKDSINVRCSIFQELDPQKKVLFEWHAQAHLSLKDIDEFYIDSLRIVSLPHISSIEKDFDGNYLVTCKWTNQLLKINAADGSVMWRLGGNGNDFTFINSPVPFYGPRDGRRISNGNITLFDGGENYRLHGAGAMEFALDETNKTATLVWSYTYDSTMTSNGRGNVQRLENGNTLINYCYNSKTNICFVVVNPEGEKIMEVSSIRSFRSFNYPSLPWQLHRPIITCYDSLGVKYLKTEKSYSSYQWSDSSVTRAIPVTKSGVYTVFVPYGDGGFISSGKLMVTDISNPCESIPAVPLIKPKELKKKKNE